MPAGTIGAPARRTNLGTPLQTAVERPVVTRGDHNPAEDGERKGSVVDIVVAVSDMETAEAALRIITRNSTSRKARARMHFPE